MSLKRLRAGGDRAAPRASLPQAVPAPAQGSPRGHASAWPERTPQVRLRLSPRRPHGGQSPLPRPGSLGTASPLLRPRPHSADLKGGTHKHCRAPTRCFLWALRGGNASRETVRIVRAAIVSVRRPLRALGRSWDAFSSGPPPGPARRGGWGAGGGDTSPSAPAAPLIRAPGTRRSGASISPQKVSSDCSVATENARPAGTGPGQWGAHPETGPAPRAMRSSPQGRRRHLQT